MVNIKKVIKEIHSDGRYDAILDVAKKKLNNDNPTLEEIEKLVLEDEYYINEYKDLNRWGELSSVHIKTLKIKEDDSQEIREIKEEIKSLKGRHFFMRNVHSDTSEKFYTRWVLSYLKGPMRKDDISLLMADQKTDAIKDEIKNKDNRGSNAKPIISSSIKEYFTVIML